MSEARSDSSDSEEEKRRLRQKAKRDRWAVEVDGRDIAKVRRSIRTLPSFVRFPQEVPLLRSATTITGSWLRHWIGNSFPCPSDAVSPLEDPLQDSIQVLIEVHEFEHTDPSSPWVDPVMFTLQLRFIVPPTSGFLVFVRRSPRFILATYFGDHEDLKRPDWVDFRYRPTPSFWVPRCLAIEMARGYLQQNENESVREEAVAWCDSITRGSFADLYSHRSNGLSQIGSVSEPPSPGPHPPTIPRRPSRRKQVVSLAPARVPLSPLDLNRHAQGAVVPT